MPPNQPMQRTRSGGLRPPARAADGRRSTSSSATSIPPIASRASPPSCATCFASAGSTLGRPEPPPSCFVTERLLRAPQRLTGRASAVRIIWETIAGAGPEDAGRRPCILLQRSAIGLRPYNPRGRCSFNIGSGSADRPEKRPISVLLLQPRAERTAARTRGPRSALGEALAPASRTWAEQRVLGA